jgi:hypothetical protein
LLQSFNTSKREELLHKTISNMVEVLEKNFKLTLKSILDYLTQANVRDTHLIHNKEKYYFFLLFQRNVKYLSSLYQNKLRRSAVKRIADQHLIIMKNDRKRKVFKEMVRICFNQRQWVNKIRYEFSKNSLW